MPNQFDVDGRGPSTLSLAGVGVVFIAIAAVAALLAIAKSKGDLDTFVRVSVALVNVGDGLPRNSDVKYRGVLVGQVKDVVTADAGKPNIVLVDLDPEYAASIPAAVTARVVPSNVFAVSSIQLIDNGHGVPLRAGAVIAEDTTLPTVMFQTTLNKFRKVFAALGQQPNDNSVGVIAAVSEAAEGRGTAIRDAGRNLNHIVKQLNTVVGDGSDPSTISALTDATAALRDVSPELFVALDSAVTPMKTLAEKRTALTSFLSAGLKTVGTMADSIDNQTDRLIAITTQLTPVVGVLADNAGAFHPITSRIKQVSDRLMNVWNADTNLFTVKAIVSLTPLRTYTRADCPRYGELAGPSCQTAPDVPTAPSLYPALGSAGFPPPPGVFGGLAPENRPNSAPPRDSTRHSGELPGPPGDVPPSGQPAAPPSVPPVSAPPPEMAQQAGEIGGNIGPVGSEQEKEQLGQIVGGDANAATQLLLGPVVRGTAVHITPDTGGAR